MYAADAMTLEELRSRLEALEEKRESVRGKLAALASWRETRNCSSSPTLHAPRRRWIASDPRSVGRYTLCSDVALPDKSLRVQGALGEENSVWENDRTSTK
jgi:hypothetical protein